MKTVVAGVIVDGERILVVRRAQGQSLAGYWEFPGGKLEDGETHQQCLEREIFEELCLHVRAGDFVAQTRFKHDHGEFELVAYFAKFLSGEMQLMVHDSALWVEPSAFADLNLAPADGPIAERIKEIFGASSPASGKPSI